MEDHVLLLMDQILDTVATRHMPTVWKSLSPDVRDGIVVAADSDNQTFLAAVLRDMQEHVDDIVDIKHMAVTACVANKGLIVKIFQECGEKEFTFIRQSGFYFGFAFGLIQMIVFMFFDAWWIMPLAGFIVGWYVDSLVRDLAHSYSTQAYQLPGAQGHFCSSRASQSLWSHNTRNFPQAPKRSVGSLCPCRHDGNLECTRHLGSHFQRSFAQQLQCHVKGPYHSVCG